MHIVFVCAEFPIFDRPTGGFGTYVDQLSQALVTAKTQVTIVCLGQRPQEFISKKRRVIVLSPDQLWLPILLQKIPLPYINRIGKFLTYPWLFSWQARQTLLRLQKSKPIDIIEGGDFGAELFFYILLRKATGMPRVVIKLHTPSFVIRKYNEENLSLFYRTIEWMEAYCLRHCDMVTSPTNALAKLVTKKLKITVDKIIAYPYVTQKRGTKRKRNDRLVLYVGKLQPKKGVATLIRSFKLVRPKYANARLVLVGPDTYQNGASYKSQLKQIVLDLQLNRSVSFVPSVSQRQVYGMMRQAAILAVPSIWENFPNVIFEGAACGAAIVASTSGGIGEMVRHGQDALLADPGNERAFAYVISRLLGNQELRHRLAQQSVRTFRKKYSPKLIVRDTIRAYTRSLKD